MADTKIKDAPLVDALDGEDKIPISDGSNAPKAVNIDMLRTIMEPADMNDDYNDDYAN